MQAKTSMSDYKSCLVKTFSPKQISGKKIILYNQLD